MGKIKKWYRSIPIWLALFLFIISALLIASFLSNKITTTVYDLSMGITAKYITVDYNVTPGAEVTYNADGSNEIVEYSFNYDKYSQEDQRLHEIYSFIQRFTPPLTYSAFILAAVLLFYFTKLKTPLKVLTKASDRIADNELDFTLDYSGYDEMAKLCAAFEKMRSALDNNNRRMLHMIDERKQLNDAYTHDLRTPIAVLKGHTDMLAKYLPTGKLSENEVLEIVGIMSSNISRLEQFVESMNTVQKLEDLSIQKESVNTEEFLGHLRESASILCQTSGLDCQFDAPITANSLCLDAGAVIQVYENLMSNAIRFARSKITIRCEYNAGSFSITVSDDGKGFSDKDLLKADKPYYSGEAKKSEHHFGLGLHICRILCEKHGGTLHLQNTPDSGAAVTAYFAIDKQD